MKDIKAFLNKWLGLQHWPFGERWGILFIIGIIIPSLLIIIGGKWSLWDSDKPDFFPILLFSLIVAPTCLNSKKPQNRFVAAAWGTFSLEVMIFCGTFFVPRLLGLIQFPLKSVSVFMIVALPILYVYCLWALPFYRKTLIEQEKAKLSRPSESHKS